MNVWIIIFIVTIILLISTYIGLKIEKCLGMPFYNKPFIFTQKCNNIDNINNVNNINEINENFTVADAK